MTRIDELERRVDILGEQLTELSTQVVRIAALIGDSDKQSIEHMKSTLAISERVLALEKRREP